MSSKIQRRALTLFLVMAISGVVSGADSSLGSGTTPWTSQWTKSTCGLYVPSNGLYVPSNELYVPDNRIYVPEKKIYVPDNTIYGPDGTPVKSSGGNILNVIKGVTGGIKVADVFIKHMADGDLWSKKFWEDLGDAVIPFPPILVPKEYIPAQASLSDAVQQVAATDQKTSKLQFTLQGLGIPQLSPSTSGPSWSPDQNKERSDIPETSGTTFIDQANNVWYIDAFSWSGDRSLYDKPAAPYRFISGELNTYGYNWIYLPFERTGMTYDQGYADWVSETLASMGMSAPSAGYGLLIDEGQNGGGGW